MDNIWDQRYGTEDYVYGKNPNQKFREYLETLSPGKILLPAEGEGRNAVFAASLGWQVDAFDLSKEGQKKALKLADEKGVKINYFIGNVLQFQPRHIDYDLVALIYLHLPEKPRKAFHQRIMGYIKKGGMLFMQAYDKEQLGMNTGGPPSLELLYSVEELREDFKDYHIVDLNKELIDHREGKLHHGLAYNLNLIVKNERPA